jgi:hypothetical protein
MITRKNAPSFLFDAPVRLAAVGVLCLAAAACNKAALLAPTNSTITLTAGSRILPNGGTTQLIATVLENSGQPVPNGTTVRFTASLGRVDPVEAETNNGVAVATFIAGNESGTAEIRAISGLATGGTGTSTGGGGTGTGGGTTTPSPSGNVVQITIGAAAASNVSLSATPSSIRRSGSTLEVLAFVRDTNGNALPNVPVTFSATRGTISPNVTNTDAEGTARTTLTSNEATSVTARVGSGAEGRTATLEIQASLTPSFQLEASPTTPTAGQPVRLTITPAENTAPRVVVDWGDGSAPQDVGTVAAARSITHTYALPGFYTINASGQQNGENFSNSIAVTVAQQPPVSVTVNPTTASVGVPFTFTITPTVGALIQNITINYGDGQEDVLGAISTQTPRQHPYQSPGTYVVTVTQREANGNQTTATVTVTVTS